MSDEIADAEHAARIARAQARGEELRRKKLDRAGLGDQYDLWRESMPEARMSDNDAYNMFMQLQGAEEAGLEGRLSVATGGEEEGLGTDIPTPGPDEEGGGPDAAPDTSKGDTERQTDLEIVPGMWTPPEESEAENYEEPSTAQMTQSAEWIKEAKVIYEFKGSPLPGDPVRDFSEYGFMFPEDDPLTDSEIGAWMRNEMSGFNWNVINTTAYAQKIMTSEDPKIALSFLNLINMYDHSDGGAMDFAGALQEMATDPTTYLGLGVGAIAAKGAAKATAKAGLKKSIQMAIIGGTGGAVEGGTLAGSFDLTVQNIEQEAGARQDIDYGRAAMATGAGVGLGTLLGAGGGHIAGRQMDKLAKAMADQKLADAARDKLLQDRANMSPSERGEAELMDALDVNPNAKEALLAETGSIPRLEDGSVDFVKIRDIMRELTAKESTQQAKTRLQEISDAADGSDNGWFYEDDRDVMSFYDAFYDESDYKAMQDLADSMGLEWDVGGRGGANSFVIEGTPDQKLAFVNEWGGIAGDSLLPIDEIMARRVGAWADTDKTGEIILTNRPDLEARGEELLDPDVHHAKGGPDSTSGVPQRYQLFDNEGKLWSTWGKPDEASTAYNALKDAEGGNPVLLDTEISGANDPMGAAGDRLAHLIDTTNETDLGIHLEAKSGGLEMTGTFQHYGPIQDVAEEIGLKVAAIPRKEGFFLRVEGTDEELLKFLKRAYEVPDALTPEAKAAWKDFMEDDLSPSGRIPDNVVPIRPPAREKFVPAIASKESQQLARKIMELEELERGDVVMRASGRPGSRVKDALGEGYEVVGRTKNGWYHLRDKLGREKSLRRKDFEVVEKAPAPRKAGPMELDPFSNTAAKIIHMNEQVVSGKLVEVKTTWKEQQQIAAELQDMGIDITAKKLSDHWSPAELVFLRDTYNNQANGMADMARRFESQLRNEGRLLDSQLAEFNNAHAQFVATRDLFFGVSGNAARQLNILRSKPVEGVYEFSRAMMDSISLQGGRANTERAIRLMSDFSSQRVSRGKKDHTVTRGISKLSQTIWGNKWAARLLNVRYNMMLSSWRTHFFNFLGNSASGVYQHMMISPVRMGINNVAYARDLARSYVDGKYKPDPADRMTMQQYSAELRGHYAATRDSLILAKEIALGRDIGEGKIWNELGLRYNIVNIPDSWYGKLGTTPVRLLEAGDAFFKNQYYNSKIHELASVRARVDEVHKGLDYETRYNKYVDDPNGAAQTEATAFAAKQTYTNDPNVYGGVLSSIAQSVSKLQNRSLFVNMIIPFVRTPANLLAYSMEMIGVQQLLTPNQTWRSISKGTQRESQEALARLTVAAGLWLVVAEMYQNGDITGTGPGNWEERKVWEAAGWQPNSVKLWDHWVSMDRAAPAGMSLTAMASMMDFYAMTQQEDKPAMEWVGAGLLYTADMILDESYLSSAVDVITAVSSKEESRFRSVTASTFNSMWIPNLLRDFRRVTDEGQRSATSVDLMDQIVKQAKNSSPWHSDDLPPTRDWKGEPVNYWGNAYLRAVIPFNVKKAGSEDKPSMALAYAGIPIAKPDKTISWPGGLGDSIDLFAMDDGGGFVYDHYLKLIGESRKETVDILMDTLTWSQLEQQGDTGPDSQGDSELRKALGIGTKIGRLRMLQFLIEHHGDNNMYKRKDGDGKDVAYVIQHPVSIQEYIRLREAIQRGIEDSFPMPDQYLMREPQEGMQFFQPDLTPDLNQ